MSPIPSDDQGGSDRSKDLTPHSRNSAFQTTLEIASGTNLIYNITHSLMTSLTASRIDAHAFAVCLKIGSALDWSIQGRERFHEAKSNLRLVFAWENILQFGFNWKGPMNEILARGDGERFAALTACLTEIYTPNIIAQIYVRLLELFGERNKDDFFLQNMSIPSSFQIRSVVERFAGMFSTSSFATSVEDYMSTDDHAVVTGGTEPRKRATRMPTSRTIAHPECIAEALYELLQLSRDGSKTQQIQLAGGADAIAVAAVGRYLVDLPTEVYKEEGSGSVVNVTGPELKIEGKPRVIVVLSEKDLLRLKMPTQSRVVCLHQMNNIIKDNKLPNPDPVVAGRCKWNKVLSRTFGDSFQTLRGMHVHLASTLGCAARIFQALAEGDESLPKQWPNACRTYTDSSFGHDYVTFALERFPELGQTLKSSEQEMQEKARLSWAEAAEQLEESLSNIARWCHCKVCWLGENPDPRGHTGAFKDQGSSKEWYCLTALTTSIIRLVRVLSGIDLMNTNLFLKRDGVEWFYKQQQARHKRQRQMAKTHTNPREERHIFRILDYVRIDKSAPEFSPLAIAHALFSGDQR